MKRHFPTVLAMALAAANLPVAHAYEDLSVAPWATEFSQPSTPGSMYHFAESFRAPDEWVIMVDVNTGELSAWLLSDTPDNPTVEVPIVTHTETGTITETITVSADLPSPPPDEGSSHGWVLGLLLALLALPALVDALRNLTPMLEQYLP